jgi:hypothetical protein
VPDADADAHVQVVLDLALLAHGTAVVDMASAIHAAATTLDGQQVAADMTDASLRITADQHGHPVASSLVVPQGTPDPSA